MSVMSGQTKRSLSKPLSRKQRAQQPRSLVDNESLAIVASIFGPLETPVASTLEKEIFMERFEKEIIRPFQFSLSSLSSTNHKGRPSGPGSSNGPKILVKGKLVEATLEPKQTKNSTARSKLQTKNALQSRLVVGTNQCTRILEATMKSSVTTINESSKDNQILPQFVVLARDLHPPTILAHIPFMCHKLGVPILLLPGKSSLELGKVLGTKKVGIFLFLTAPVETSENKTNDKRKTTDAISTKDNKAIDSFLEFCRSKFISSPPQKCAMKSKITQK